MFLENSLLPLLYRIRLILVLAVTWILIFQGARALFFTYQFFFSSRESGTSFLPSAWHGLAMDISMAGYLSLLPTLLLMGTHRRWEWYRRVMLIYSILLSILVALIVTVDLEVFKAWHFRLDITPLYFLEQPTEALASASSSPLLLLLVLFLALASSISLIFRTILHRQLVLFGPSPFRVTPVVFLVFSALLIIPIRGGLQLAPMNQSSVYFSTDNFANQLAVNAPWNFLSSVVRGSGRHTNPFLTIDSEQAEGLLHSLQPASHSTIPLIARDSTANVLIIIWESLTAKAVNSLGGIPDVTPGFDSLARQGILFTKIFASGDRSAKGLVAILSGYPAQPTTSIIKEPGKTATLPSLPRVFKKHGYHNSFYYGGETEFANMKSYLLQHGFDRIIDHKEFNKANKNSKWGAHDHVLFNRLLTDLDTQTSPFFTTLFTLSSHEPFEVPGETAIPGTALDQKFLNSLHYTDASLESFIRQAKTKPWWKNTLIVVLADHGHPLPKTSGGRTSEFHIPMLWLGGIVEAKKGTRIDTLGSQTDLASTLLNQLGHDASDFVWSNDLLRKGRVPYAFYSFNNGFGWVRPEGVLVYDNVGKRTLETGGTMGIDGQKVGQVYLQSLFADYLKR